MAVSRPPRFCFDLNVPAIDRWAPIIRSLSIDWSLVRQELMQVIHSSIPQSWLLAIIRMILPQMPMYYKDELRGISQCLQIPLADLMLLQLVYEVNACCTSLIHRDPESGAMSLFRTMDWDLPWLQLLTVELDVVRGTEPVCQAVTWCGYVGFLTGVNQHMAVSINFRSVGNSIWSNLFRMVTWRWPIGFLLREVLCSNNPSESSALEAVTSLCHSGLIAPCYITLCRPYGQHCIIVRDPDAFAMETKSRAQTNHDQTPYGGLSTCDENFLYSRERLDKIRREDPGLMTADTVWQFFAQAPIHNEETIYTCRMIPGDHFTTDTRFL